MIIKKEKYWIKFKFTDLDYKTNPKNIKIFLESIKLNIPKHGRRYMSSRKIWMISISFQKIFDELYLKYIDKSQLKVIK